MVVYRQNLANMIHNSVIMQSLLRIRKKIKFRGHFAHKCKTSGGYLQNMILTNKRIWRRG